MRGAAAGALAACLVSWAPAPPAARRRRHRSHALHRSHITLSTHARPARSFFARSDLAFVFHAFALMFYVRTWMWHTTPAAAVLPGSQGFGWFFRCAFRVM